jgi:uncharacterized protein
MLSPSIIETAIGGHGQVPSDWMSATRVRPFILNDPALVWLEFYGKGHGFEPDTSPYDFLTFISEKARGFEEKWIKEMAPEAVRVCVEAFEVRSATKMEETFYMMRKGVPVICQPALWWAPERIYGVPDLIIHTTWLQKRFPGLLTSSERQTIAENLGPSNGPGHYIVFDMKFTTRLGAPNKMRDLEIYSAQIRIYAYILGHLQGAMPLRSFLITRDRVTDFEAVKVNSRLHHPLDRYLAAMRDQFSEIKSKGAHYLPWRDECVASNVANHDERWHTAKEVIASEKVPGGDTGRLYQVGPTAKRDLAMLGFPSLASLMERSPAQIPFEKCKGLGPEKISIMRAILEANRSGMPLLPPGEVIPVEKPLEFFIDFEYFTNVNVDFERQWPELEGCEMIFMIGVGGVRHGQWYFERFVAVAEDHDRERWMLEALTSFLETESGGALGDGSRAALYHWSSAEVWQIGKAADRHRLPRGHSLRRLPWVDLQRVFKNGPCGLPGAWGFGLKEVAKAVGKVNPVYAPQWPGDLDAGLRAMVMGWRAYEKEDPVQSAEMESITEYLEADCQALWKILGWLRSIRD